MTYKIYIYTENTGPRQVYLISKGHLPPEGAPEGAEKSKQPIQGFWRYIPIAIYILKLYDIGYLGKYISIPKGTSLLKVLPKVQEISNHSKGYGDRPYYPYIYSETT